MCASKSLGATRIGILLLALAATFVLGWWWGRSEPAEAPPAARSAEPEVQLRIDAGGISLLPDGGLHLKPLPPLDAGIEE
jgi:hypothetical protein